MALTDKLTAIATAIRARTGKSALMTLDQMPTEIAGIEDHEIEDALLTNALSETYENTRITVLASDAMRASTHVKNVSFPEVITIGARAFYACSSLLGVSFPKAQTLTGTTFYNCSNLGSAGISLPKIETIGAQAFYNCSSLTYLSFDEITAVPTLSNVNAFQGCSSLEALYFPDALVASAKTTTNWSTFEDIILPLSQKP